MFGETNALFLRIQSTDVPGVLATSSWISSDCVRRS